MWPVSILRKSMNRRCITSLSVVTTRRKVLLSIRARDLHYSPLILQPKVPDYQELHSTTSHVESSSSNDPSPPSWQWVPPRARSTDISDEGGENVVPINKGEYLTVEEVERLLTHLKGEHVVTVPIGKDKIFDGIEHFVLVSGESPRHLRRMAEAVLKQVRGRRLKRAAAFKNGIEGDKVDDWLAVDCHNLVVHCMMPAMRKSLDLESHWSDQPRPFAKHAGTDKSYEDSLDKLFNQFPPPPDHHEEALREAGRQREDRGGEKGVASTVIRFPSQTPQDL